MEASYICVLDTGLAATVIGEESSRLTPRSCQSACRTRDSSSASIKVSINVSKLARPQLECISKWTLTDVMRDTLETRGKARDTDGGGLHLLSTVQSIPITRQSDTGVTGEQSGYSHHGCVPIAYGVTKMAVPMTPMVRLPQTGRPCLRGDEKRVDDERPKYSSPKYRQE